MKLLSSLSRVVPREYLAPSAIAELIKLLKKEKQEVINNATATAKTKLAKLEKVFDDLQALANDPNLIDIPTEAKKLIDSAVALFPASKQQTIKNEKAYKTTLKLLDQWEQVVAPIGEQTEGLNKTFTFDKAYDSEIKDFAVGLSVGAEGSYNLNVLNRVSALELAKLDIAESDCLINQSVSAAYKVNASLAGTIEAINISASLAQAGELKLSTYFQVGANTPTYQALWLMYKTPVMPWSLPSMQVLLQQPTVTNKLAGYRACSMNTGTSFTLKGKMGIGKSLVTKSDLKGNLIEVDFSAEIGASREHTLSGDVSLLVTKQAGSGKLLLKVTIEESNEQTNALNLALGAQIKGLDKLAGQYVEALLVKGDDLVKWLEDNSSPGEELVKSLQNTVSDDAWYKPIANLALGQTDVDDAVKALIDDELANLIDRIPLSSEEDAEELTDKVLTKLFDVFGVSDAASDTLKPLKDKAEATLSDKLKDVQSKIKDQADEFANKISGKTKQELQPIAALGKEVSDALNNFNSQVEANFNLVISKYKAFKEKITKALEKSANIKLGLAYDELRKRSESLTHTLEILLEEPDSADVQTLYRSLVIGDEKKVSRLLPKLKQENKITIISESAAIQTIRNNTTTLGLSIIGNDINSLKDVMAQLNVEVDPSGNLFVRQEYKVSATASGLGETREAVLNLTYGIFQAAQNPDFVGSVGLDYTNSDDKLHSANEIMDFFDSLDFRDDKRFADFPGDVAVPVLIPQERIMPAITEYQKALSQTPALYTKSQISISLRASKQTYEKLLGLNANNLFNSAIVYLVYLTKKNDIIDPALKNILKLYEVLDSDYEDYNKLFTDLTGSPTSTNISMNAIKNDLKKLDDFQRLLGDIPKKSDGAKKYGWRAINATFEKYVKVARALSKLPETLNAIETAVTKFSAGTSPKDDLVALNTQLKTLNKRFQKDLDEWVSVENIPKNWLEDLYSKLGIAQSGINLRLLSLFLLLQESIGEDEELFLTTITLSNAADDRRVIVV